MDKTLAKFFDEIQSGVAVVAKYVPTIESVVAVTASIFNPAALPVVQGIAGVTNLIIGVLGNLSAVTHPVEGAAPKAGQPVVVGQTAQGIVITGHKL